MSLPCRRLRLTCSVAASMLLAVAPPVSAQEPPALPVLCVLQSGGACVRAILDRARREAESIGDPAVPGEAGLVDELRSAFAAARKAAEKIADAEDRAEQFAFLAKAEPKAAGFVVYSRMWTLALVARATAEAGFPAEGNAMVPSILRDWAEHAKISADGEDFLVVHVARKQVEFGFIDDALATVGRIGKTRHRDTALTSVAVALAEAERLDEAFASIERISDPKAEADALRDIARAQARLARFAEAQETIGRIAPGEQRAWAQRDLAGALADAGRIDEGLAMALDIADESWKRTAVSHIVDAQADAGLLEDALATAGLVAGLDGAFSDIARAQARLGQFAAALSTAERIGSVSWRAGAIGDIAAAQAAVGLAEDARRTFATARAIAEGVVNDSGSDQRSRALGSLAVAQAKAGLFEEALATAGAVEMAGYRVPLFTMGAFGSAESRIESLRMIAIEQAKAGLVDAARGTFALALRAAAQNPSDILAIAAAQVEAGLSEEARGTFDAAVSAAEVAAKAEPDWTEEGGQASVLRRIAEAQVAAGQVDDARATFALAMSALEKIADASVRASALTGIGGIQAKAGLSADARRSLTAAADVLQRAASKFEKIQLAWQLPLCIQFEFFGPPVGSLLEEVVLAQVKARFIGDALQTAGRGTSACGKALDFAAIAKALSRNSDL